MRGKPPVLKIELTDDERAELEARARQRSAPHLEVVRAKAILMAAEGARNVVIAEAVGFGPRSISIWRGEFLERRLDSLKERRRSGRTRTFSP